MALSKLVSDTGEHTSAQSAYAIQYIGHYAKPNIFH